MHLPTLDIRVEQNGNRVSSDHFRLSSGLSVLSRGQIRILPVKFRSLYVNERSNPVTSGSIPVSPCQGEVKSGYFRSSSGLYVLRRGQNPVRLCSWADKKPKARVVRMHWHVFGLIMQLRREKTEGKGGKKESLLHWHVFGLIMQLSR